MKAVIILSVVSAMVLMLEAAPGKFDSFDIDNAAKDPKFVKDCIECYLNEGPCSDFAGYYKELFPKILSGGCDFCTPAQKHTLKVIFDAGFQLYPEKMTAFAKIADPSGAHIPALMAAVSQA